MAFISHLYYREYALIALWRAVCPFFDLCIYPVHSSEITESEIPLAQVSTAVMYLDLSHLDSLSLTLI